MNVHLPPSLQEAFSGLWTARFTFTATMAVQIYEYVTTFDTEYQFFWRPKFTLSKILFFVNRYVPFVTSAFLFAAFFVSSASNRNLCSNSVMVSAILCATQFSFAEYVLIVRAYAIWKENKYIKTFLCSILLPVTGVAFYFAYDYGRVMTSIDIKLASPGCIVIGVGSMVKALVTIVCAETLSLFLLVAHAYRYVKGNNFRLDASIPSLLQTLLRDGVAYFVCIIALAIGNVLVNFLARGVLHPVFLPLQATLQNILYDSVDAYQQSNGHGRVASEMMFGNRTGLAERSVGESIVV